jgi:uncharacterized protein
MNYKTDTIHFTSDGIRLAGHLAYPTEIEKPPGILFIHGAGKSTSHRYEPWQEYLAERGMSSFAFDCRGVGDSEGNFEDGGLHNRLTDSKNALETFKNSGKVDVTKISVGGGSMGGHIAIRLSEVDPSIKNILLFYAAAYAAEAENKPLNEEFTEILRSENSWKNSPVFKILENFPGHVFVLYGEYDKVIPQEIQDIYLNIAKEKGDGYLLLGIGHKLQMPETPREHEGMQEMFEYSYQFLKKYNS